MRTLNRMEMSAALHIVPTPFTALYLLAARRGRWQSLMTFRTMYLLISRAVGCLLCAAKTMSLGTRWRGSVSLRPASSQFPAVPSVGGAFQPLLWDNPHPSLPLIPECERASCYPSHRNFL